MQQNVTLSLEINEVLVFSYDNVINEQTIIDTTKQLETLLIKYKAKPEKMKNVFEVLVEVLQNILHYSYDMKILQNNKKEAYGSIVLAYNTDNDAYTLKSVNTISKAHKQRITERLDEVKGLDDTELRKLSRSKMRSRNDNHQDGAGLGFVMMARKSSAPLEVEFIDNDSHTFFYKQCITI